MPFSKDNVGLQDAETSAFHNTTSLFDDQEITECLLNHPQANAQTPFAIDHPTIAAKQNEDDRLLRLAKTKPKEHAHVVFRENDKPVVCHRREDSLQVCLPDSMVDSVVRFYHQTLVHPGRGRMLASMRQHFENPKLEAAVERLVSTCDACQKCKLIGHGYGHLPARDPFMAPWHEIAVDLVGPWDFRDAHGDTIEFMALTIIDTVTNLCKIVPMQNKTAKHIGLLLENAWVARHPKPVKCIYDQGNEFLGAAFQAKLEELDVTPSAAGAKNPQANSIVERLHQSVANALRMLSHAHPPETQADKEDLVNTALQTASCANKATTHSTMKASPGAAAFSRDVIINVPTLADFRLLKARREAVINYNLL